MNLTDELETSFGDGPAHRPVEQRIAAGRRLVRRRRALGGDAALAVVAALGAGYAVVAPDGYPPTRPDAAGRHDDRHDQGREGVAIELERDGRLWTAPGVEVLRQVPNPYGLRAPELSLAVEYAQHGQTWWSTLEWQRNRNGWAGGTMTEKAAQAIPTFDLWVEVVGVGLGEHPLFHLVRHGPGGRLEPVPGVELIDQITDVDLGPDAGGDANTVAEVRYEGRRWYAMVSDDPADGYAQLPAAAEVTEPTLERFVQRLETDPDYFDGLW